MSGFLSRFLRNNRNQIASGSSRLGPKPTENSNDSHHEADETLHPDEVFIDLGPELNTSSSIDPETTNHRKHFDQYNSSNEPNNSTENKTNYPPQDNTLQDNPQPPNDEEVDPYGLQKNFNPSWMKAAKENRNVNSVSIQTTFDNSGNSFIHYAAAFGGSSLLRQLIEKGWSLKKQNHHGKTPYDFAVRYNNSVNIYFIENLLKSNQSTLEISQTSSQLTTEDSIEQKTLDQNEKSSDARKSTYKNSDTIATPAPPSLEDSSLTSSVEKIEEAIENWDDLIENFQIEPQIIEENEKFDASISHWDANAKDASKHACAQCGTSFHNLKIYTKIRFCPSCGAEQHEAEEIVEKENENNLIQLEDQDPNGVICENHPSDILKSSPKNESPEKSSNPTANIEKIPEDFTYTQHNKSVNFLNSEEIIHETDEDFDTDSIDIDLQIYKPEQRGRNSSEENYDFFVGTNDYRSDQNVKAEWEIFLDEDLEEQSHPSDQYFEDEDPLEQGRIVEYSSRLTRRITFYQSKDRLRINAFFITVLGDFPFYQSYAAIERLILRDVQLDQIQDAYSIKLIWATNPNIWSSRRYNRMENAWTVSRNAKLRNSMSWQLASDLATFHTPNELENLLLNDWYAEWLNLPLHGGETASGLDPAYSLYPTYLYEKRRSLTANLNIW